MTDSEAPAPTSVAEAPAAPEPERKLIETPMMAFMKGGTLTGAYERQLAEQKHNAEQSRKVEDARRQAAESGNLEYRQHRHVLGGNRKFPGIVLEVRHPKDRVVLDYIECELSTNDDGTLILILACWKCYHRTGDASNLTVRQNHRHFELDMRRKGELWVNPKNPQHIVTLAGTITTTEAITCPNLGCGNRFVIDDSVVREK